MDDGIFIETVRDHFLRNRRGFSWRDEISPYRVHVSEMMLQQTQTVRVASMYESFVRRFPDYRSLAAASLSALLDAWQGLGYNRRVLFLKQAAQIILSDYGGILPGQEATLKSLPGIGPNTAGSILAFAYNLPTVFIETNIRTVFLHHYFPDQVAADREILPLVSRTLDTLNPREWYWALMDYGVHLKKTIGNASRRSSHQVVQTRFEGSVRQVRGEILRILLSAKQQGKALDFEQLFAAVQGNLEPDSVRQADISRRYRQALTGLLRDELVVEQTRYYRLAD